MDQQDSSRETAQRDPALHEWITAALFIVLCISCMGLFVTSVGSGLEINGQPVHYRLVSSVTQSPFCPPEDPRLSSMLLERKRWIVCLIREPNTSGRPVRSMHKLIDLELWK